jgi:hypothetical protein
VKLSSLVLVRLLAGLVSGRPVITLDEAGIICAGVAWRRTGQRAAVKRLDAEQLLAEKGVPHSGTAATGRRASD